jgi:hypothetical protein
MKIAVLGNGSLSNAFQKYTKHQTTVFSKPTIDFLNIKTLDSKVDELLSHDVIFNTIGLYSGSSSDVLQVNFLTPVLLLEKLTSAGYDGKIILTGSHGSSWISWPEISHERLVYNVSKLNLRNYVMGLSQSNLSKARLCLVDTTKFVSKMSNFTGDAIENVVALIENVIDINSPKILHIETY